MEDDFSFRCGKNPRNEGVYAYKCPIETLFTDSRRFSATQRAGAMALVQRFQNTNANTRNRGVEFHEYNVKNRCFNATWGSDN